MLSAKKYCAYETLKEIDVNHEAYNSLTKDLSQREKSYQKIANNIKNFLNKNETVLLFNSLYETYDKLTLRTLSRKE